MNQSGAPGCWLKTKRSISAASPKSLDDPSRTLAELAARSGYDRKLPFRTDKSARTQARSHLKRSDPSVARSGSEEGNFAAAANHREFVVGEEVHARDHRRVAGADVELLDYLEVARVEEDHAALLCRDR